MFGGIVREKVQGNGLGKSSGNGLGCGLGRGQLDLDLDLDLDIYLMTSFVWDLDDLHILLWILKSLKNK